MKTKNQSKKIVAETLGAVHTHTHTHTSSLEACSLWNKIEYMLGKLQIERR